NNGYFPANIIEVGKGYWVKTSSAGSLSYSSLYKNSESKEIFNSFERITFEDALARKLNLYLTDDKLTNLDYFELPPLPPSNQVDVRFSSNRFVENKVGKLELLCQGLSYPVKVKFHSNSKSKLSLELSNGIKHTLANGETFTITDSKVNSIFIESQKLITNFELNQNYPNPFNPKTIIEFSLAKDGKVKLVLFNILGEKLRVLIDKEMSAGNHRYELNIDEINLNIPSGVYIYQLEAGGLKLNRKMILSK
ncbi:MAG: T9SS type A sorting domain-containing protein, partial [Ignavibacteria bacterium]|nr:T9SS type A sorting domain-containing protein [Ignavibacteria bacterium]